MEDERDTGLAAVTGLNALEQFVARVSPLAGQDITEHLDTATAEVLDGLEAAGVSALLLKGRALAVLLYRRGERRGYSDVDLLVAPGDVDAAERALERLGYANADASRGIDEIGGTMHAEMWIRTAAGPTGQPMVDLHRWLPGSRAAPAAAWEALAARRVWIEVGGRRAGALDRGGQALHLATHAAQHGPSFEKHVDELALALERWSADVWDEAAALAQKLEATEGFAAGLRLLPDGVALATRLGLPATAELDWTIRNRAVRPRGTFHLRALQDADGVRDRVQILRHALLPRRAWIVYEHRWARKGGLYLAAAYALHITQAVAWAVSAWRFLRRAKRAAG
jgi:hypothetical protein